MRDQQFVLNAREKNQQNLKDVADARHTSEARALDGIQKRHDEIERKIKALQEEKTEALTGEITKTELLKDALSRLKMRRSETIKFFLHAHLESCKGANLAPFTGNLFQDHQAKQIIWLVLTEEDIKEAISGLSENGITEEERKTKVKQIDQEIDKLLTTLKAES